MNRDARLGLYIGIGVVLLVVLGLGLSITHSVRSLDFTVLFADAKGLQKGDRVVLNGVDIGRVRGVELGAAGASGSPVRVPLRIEPAHAGRVLADARAIIRSVSFPNVSGQKVVEVLNPAAPTGTGPMSDGMVINGLDSELQYRAWQLKGQLQEGIKALDQGAEELGKTLGELSGQIKTLATSPEAQAALRQLQDFAAEMNTKGRAALGELQARWPELRAKVEPLVKQLIEFGREKLATQLNEMMKQIDGTLRRWQQEAPAGGPPPITPEEVSTPLPAAAPSTQQII